MPVEMPWLICCSTMPLNPAGFSAKMPSVQKPRWLTDEYATSFFMSFCIRRNQRAVDDADDRQDDHPAAHFGMHDHVREERQREADEAVGSHLQQDAGQDDRARGGRLDVRVGQPGVEREHRHLDGEAQEEGEEEPESAKVDPYAGSWKISGAVLYRA